MDMLVKYLWEETKEEVDEFKYGILFYTLEDKLVIGVVIKAKIITSPKNS